MSGFFSAGSALAITDMSQCKTRPHQRDVRRPVAHDAMVVRADVEPADIIAPYNEDVSFFFSCCAIVFGSFLFLNCLYSDLLNPLSYVVTSSSGSRVGCRGEIHRTSSSALFSLVTRHSSLAPHFFLIVPIDAVKIPIISSRSAIRCLITPSSSQCFIRS